MRRSLTSAGRIEFDCDREPPELDEPPVLVLEKVAAEPRRAKELRVEIMELRTELRVELRMELR